MKQDEDLPRAAYTACQRRRTTMVVGAQNSEGTFGTSSHVVATSNKILALCDRDLIVPSASRHLRWFQNGGKTLAKWRGGDKWRK